MSLRKSTEYSSIYEKKQSWLISSCRTCFFPRTIVIVWQVVAVFRHYRKDIFPNCGRTVKACCHGKQKGYMFASLLWGIKSALIYYNYIRVPEIPSTRKRISSWNLISPVLIIHSLYMYIFIYIARIHKCIWKIFYLKWDRGRNIGFDRVWSNVVCPVFQSTVLSSVIICLNSFYNTSYMDTSLLGKLSAKCGVE